MFSVSPEIYSVLSDASRWLFAFFALMLLLFALGWHRSDRKERRDRFKNLPGAGTVGELVVISGSDRLPQDTWFPVPREGVLGSLRSCDLVVPCPGVRSQHLDFSWQDGTGLLIRPRAGCDVLVNGLYQMEQGQRFSPVRSLVFSATGRYNATENAPNTTVVHEKYAPNLPANAGGGSLAVHPPVQLGDADHLATTFDISHLTEPLDDREEGTLSFYFKAEEVPASDPGTGDSGTDDPEVGGDDDPPDPPQVVVTEATSVTVEIGDRKEGLGKPALLWKEAPPYEVMSRFRSSATMKRRGIFIEVRDDGIYFVTGTTLIIR